MRILHSWLEDYINIDVSPEELAEKLGMLGLEVEGYEHLAEKYAGFVVGKVEEVVKHPQADRLLVCKVDVGSEVLQIVCGAPNVAVGQKVPVGKVGATVPKNQHDPSGKPLQLSKVRIRGVESSGMICSEYELDLGRDSQGILVLDSSAKTGKPLAEYFGLNDVAYDVEITPNRPDWLSHIGIAREIGVIFKKRPKPPTVRVRQSKTPISKHLSVRIEDKKNCLRFATRMIRNVKVGPSPRWLQNRLRNVGLRPRNNVVDITNFVMLECGQPLHAFDYSLLRNHEIVVRAMRGEKQFTTLDGKEHKIPIGTVMVCDGEGEVSIAGIMGGANSEIRDTTVDVVLEAACWNPSSIRHSRRMLGISTDASQRFERGTDPDGVLYGLQRATQLVNEIAGGEVLHGIIDIKARDISPLVIDLRTSRVNAILGTSFTESKITGLLRLLNIIPVRKNVRSTGFQVPSYRVDIEREIDLIEEVARVYGYDRIEEKSTASIDFSHPFGRRDPADRVKQVLVGLGFHESMSYTLVDSGAARIAGATPVQLMNPQTSENSHMRTSLVPGLLNAVARNLSFGSSDLRLFEVGKVYSRDESNIPKTVGNFLEEERVCLLISGSREPKYWKGNAEPVDFFDIKGLVLDLLSHFALDKSGFICYSTSNRLADSAVAIEINGSYVGYAGHVHDDLLKRYTIEQDVFVAELALDVFRGNAQASRYSTLPKFPVVTRDVAFVLDDAIPAQEVVQAMERAGGDYLQSVDVFDLYRGENLPVGKKSLAFTLSLMSHERTLTESEIDAEVKLITEAVISKTGGILRTS